MAILWATLTRTICGTRYLMSKPFDHANGASDDGGPAMPSPETGHPSWPTGAPAAAASSYPGPPQTAQPNQQPAYSEYGYGKHGHREYGPGEQPRDQPTYGQQTYSQPTYGQQPYYQQSFGYSAAQTQQFQPEQKAGWGLKIALIAAGLAIVLVAIAIFAPSGSSTHNTAASGNTPPAPTTDASAPTTSAHRLMLAANAGRFVLDTGSTAADLRNNIIARYKATGNAIWANAVVGVYRTSDSTMPGSVFVGLDAAKAPAARADLADAPASVADGFLLGAGVSNAKAYPAGPLGGTFRCGTLRTTPQPVCVWVDNTTLGAMLWLRDEPISTAAADLLQVRSANEK